MSPPFGRVPDRRSDAPLSVCEGKRVLARRAGALGPPSRHGRAGGPDGQADRAARVDTIPTPVLLRRASADGSDPRAGSGFSRSTCSPRDRNYRSPRVGWMMGHHRKPARCGSGAGAVRERCALACGHAAGDRERAGCGSVSSGETRGTGSAGARQCGAGAPFPTSAHSGAIMGHRRGGAGTPRE